MHFLKRLGMAAVAAAGLLFVAGIPVQNSVTVVANLTKLQATPITAAYDGLVTRVTDGAAGAPPMSFTPGSGTCSSAGLVNDGASCVNTVGGNHWKGVFPAAGADVREWGAACGTSDSTTPVQNGVNYVVASGGGTVLLTCPIHIAGTVTIGAQNTGSIRIHGVGPMYSAGLLASVWPQTSGPAIDCGSTTGNCLQVAGQGVELDHFAMGNTQPTPSGSWTPTSFGYLIGTTDTANWAGLYIHDMVLTAATQCIDLEGSPSYNTVGIAGSQYTLNTIWMNGCWNEGIYMHNLDNTGEIDNLEQDFWWNRGNAAVGTYFKTHAIGMTWAYVANARLNGIEFFSNYKAIDQINSTVSGGFNATFAAAAIQGTNISFNEVCQAMANESGTALISSGHFTNVTLYQDTTDPSVNCPLNSQAAIDLSASFGANWVMENVRVGDVQTIADIGPNSALHLDNVDVLAYSYFAAGAPAFKVSAGADFSLGNSLIAAIRPASGAGLLLGPGFDSTQGYQQPICVGGGTNAKEGAACLAGSLGASNSGTVNFYDKSGTLQGFAGTASSTGLNIDAPNGTVYLLPKNGANTMSVGSSGGNLIINVNGLPTSCSGQATGTIWDNAGTLTACP